MKDHHNKDAVDKKKSLKLLENYESRKIIAVKGI